VANVAKNHDQQVEQDPIGRLAEVIAELIRAGALKWSAHAGKPVTRPGKLDPEVEQWLRDTPSEPDVITKIAVLLAALFQTVTRDAYDYAEDAGMPPLDGVTSVADNIERWLRDGR
jgi:hypothetical protein